MEVTQTVPIQPVGSGGGNGGGAGPGGGKHDPKHEEQETARHGTGHGHTEPAINVSGLLSMDGLTPEAQHAIERMAAEVEPLRRHLVQAQAELDEAKTLAHRHDVAPCLNRRGFLAELDKLIHRLEHLEARPALILLHLAGGDEVRRMRGRKALDDLLVRVAGLLADPARNIMLAGNIGGNDFALVVLEDGLDGARRKAADLVADLAAMPMAAESNRHALAGVALLGPGMTAEAAVAAADADMR